MDAPKPPLSAETLTDRQKEILQLIASGFSTLQIAHELGISDRTVETQRNMIKRALGVRSSGEILRAAIELGIVHPRQLYDP